MFKDKGNLNLEEGDHKLKEGLYLRKQKGKYRLIYPPKKDLSKPFNLKNIHWKNFIGFHQWMTTLIIFLVILSSVAYMNDTAECREFVNNMSSVCMEWNKMQSDKAFEPFSGQYPFDEKKEDGIIGEHNISLYS